MIASKANAITLFPSVMEVKLNPGESRQYFLALYNDEKEEIELSAIVERYIPKGKETAEDDFQNQALKWVDVPLKVTLKPGETKKIPLRLTVPETADIGGYYTSLIWQNTSKTVESQLSLSVRLGTVIFLQVGDIKDQNLEIIEFNILEKKSIFSSQINFYSQIENTGNIHLNPKGEIQIFNSFGNPVEVTKFNENMNLILPKSTRSYEILWKQGTGKNIFEGFNPRNWGRFKAKLHLEYGDPIRDKDSEEVYFWIIPWQAILLIFLILILLSVIISKIIFRKNAKE